MRIKLLSTLSALSLIIVGASVGTSTFANHHEGHSKDHSRTGFQHKAGHDHDHHHGAHKHSWMTTIETRIAGAITGQDREAKDVEAGPFKGTIEIEEKRSPDILVNVAKFVTPQIAIKGVLGYSKIETTVTSKFPAAAGGTTETEEEETSFTLGAGINYSFMDDIESSPYAEALFLIRSKKEDKNGEDSTSLGYGARLSVGYRFPLFNHISYAPSIDYLYLTGDSEWDKSASIATGKDYDGKTTEWAISFIKFDIMF